MNQSILFQDLQSWSEEKRSVMFPAQQYGYGIDCLISLEKLEELKGKSIEGKEEALQIFAEYRFDIEELATELIEDEVFNSFGQVEIS